jgi:hypothetical protein
MMSAGVEIKVIDPNDSSIYARSANSRLISSDDQAHNRVTASKTVQIASGKRRGFEAKNDSSKKQTSERRVNSHMPKFDDEELKTPTVVFEAVSIAEEAPVVVDLRTVAEEELAPLSPKLLSEYGKNMVQLNISPPAPRKVDLAPKEIITEKPKSNRKQVSKRRKDLPTPPVESDSDKTETTSMVIEPVILETAVLHEVGTEEIAPKSSRRRVAADAVQVVENPPSDRKKPSSHRRPISNRRETVEPVAKIFEPVSTSMVIEPQITEKPKSIRYEPLDQLVEAVELSPRASRRTAKSSPRKVDPEEKPKSREASPPSPKSGNLHYDDRSVISPQPIVDTQGSDRHSNRRRDVTKVKSDPRAAIDVPKTIVQPKVSSTKKVHKPPTDRIQKPQVSSRPKSPHRVSHDQPTIRIGGREVTSRDYVTSDSSSTRNPDKPMHDEDYSQEATPPTPSDSSNTDTTARRKIKSRQDAIDKGIKEKLNGDEFCPEDDEHLGMAIKIALEESQKQSVQEALEAGHDLNAEVLKSLHRPNAISEVIEKLVSQRREKIHDKQVSHRKSHKKENSKQSLNRKSLGNSKENTAKHLKSQVNDKAVKKTVASPKVSLAEDDAEEDDIETPSSSETVEEIFTQPAIFTPPPPKVPTPPKKKTTSKRKIAKPVIIEEIAQEEDEKPKVKSVKKSKPRIEEPVVEESESADNEDGMVEEDPEENVKLPKANRSPKPTDDPHVEDIRTGKNILKQKDLVYDPLGLPDEPEEDSESLGDNVYEESSEDDDVKMTINEKKDEMFYRFKLVREAYPGISLPRITRKMKLAKMVRYYEHVMSRIKLKVKTNNFKIFLIIGFLVMQFAGKKLGLNTEGFTVNQMTSMKRYERMLREFGESDWSSVGVDLPVTIRLPFFMLVNMGIFVIAKWIFQKTKKDYSVQFHKLYAQLTGGDDYVFLKDETGDNGLGAGDAAEDGGGGIFGMLKPILSMFGGMGNSTNDGEEKPKRGEAAGPTYSRKKKKPAT